jgi:hypothetical protein
MRLLLAFLLLSSTLASGQCLVIDHRHTNAGMIPERWMERARQMTVHYAHTSHGSQITSGLIALEGSDPRYRVAVREAGTAGLPEAEDPPALRIYDGNPPETYVEPDGYWASPQGLASTDKVAESGDYGLSMWSWCGQQSENDVATVDRYLAAMHSLEKRHGGMRFVLMTGHTDGGSESLRRNNQRIRDYCQANDMVLFDFADIEGWDPAGRSQAGADDSCGWCADWCESHPQDCTGLSEECAHSHPLNCKLKAQAFWWMMARLAGWDGLPEAENAAAYQTTTTTHEVMSPSTTIGRPTASSTTATTLIGGESLAPEERRPGLIEWIFLFVRRMLGLDA